MATSVNFTAPLLLGIVLDAYGPRICSVISISIVMLGFLLFGASSEGFPAFLPAVVLIAFGGPGVQSSIIHLSNLYPTHKATITSVITGSFNLSFIVFFVFDRLWALAGLSYQVIFLSYGAVCVVALGISLLLWPDKPFSFGEQLQEEEVQPDQLKPGGTKIGPIRAPSVFIRKGPSTPKMFHKGKAAPAPAPAQVTEATGLLGKEAPAKESLKESGTIWEQFRSAAFMRVTTFIVVGSFWANFYIGTIDIQLADLNFLSEREQSLMVRLFTAITTAGVLGIPLVGRLMDRFGFVTTASVTVTMAVLFGAGVLLGPMGAAPHMAALQLALSFVAYALFRTFLFTYFFAYLADALGFRYFGVLAGISFLFAGAAGLLQSPLLELGAGTCHLTVPAEPGCFQGRWQWINVAQLACLACLYIIPVLDAREEKYQQQKHIEQDSRGMKGSAGHSRSSMPRYTQFQEQA